MQAKELRELTLYQNLQTVISRRRFRIYIPAMNVLYAGYLRYLDILNISTTEWRLLEKKAISFASKIPIKF